MAEEKLYLWEYDLSWMGMVVAIAPTEEEALELFNNHPCYREDEFDRENLIRHDIVSGRTIVNTGDW